MVSLKCVRAATERIGLGRDRASARITAHRRARAGEVGCGSGGLATEGLTRKRDVETGIFRRADRDLCERRRVAGQIIALVDRNRCRANAPCRCAATTRRALAIILYPIVKKVLLSKHVSRIGGTVALSLVKNAQGKARRDDIGRQTL